MAKVGGDDDGETHAIRRKGLKERCVSHRKSAVTVSSARKAEITVSSGSFARAVSLKTNSNLWTQNEYKRSISDSAVYTATSKNLAKSSKLTFLQKKVAITPRLVRKYSMIDVAYGYTGDTEEEVYQVRNNKKSYKKKFGKYPKHRHRLNGVQWHTVSSSDEESGYAGSYDRSLRCSRRSRKSQIQTANKPMAKHNCVKYPSKSTYIYDGSGEESDPIVEHRVHAYSRKPKVLTKRRMQYTDIDTTASEASDVENLSDIMF